MSGFSTGIGIPLTLNETALDAAEARIEARLTAFASRMQKTLNLSVNVTDQTGGGPTTLGMSPEQRMTGGSSPAGQWRFGAPPSAAWDPFANRGEGAFVTPGGPVSPAAAWNPFANRGEGAMVGGRGGGTQVYNPIDRTWDDTGGRFGSESSERAWAVRSFREARSETDAAASLSDRAEMASAVSRFRNARVTQNLADTGGRFGSDEEEAAWALRSFRAARRTQRQQESEEDGGGSGFRIGARFAAAFAIKEIADVAGELYDVHAQNFMDQFTPSQTQMNQNMASARQRMSGFSGLLNAGANFAYRALVGPQGFFLRDTPFDPEAEYRASYDADLGIEQVKLNTARAAQVGAQRTSLTRASSLLPNILEENPNIARTRESRASATAARQSLDAEGENLKQQLNDARSTNDQHAIQQITSRLSAFNSTVSDRRQLIDQTEALEQQRAARDEGFYQLKTGLALGGRNRSLREDIAHPRNPLFGNIENMVTAGEEEILSYTQAGRPEFAKKSRENALLGIQAAKKRWESGFEGQEVSWDELDRVLDVNTTENPNEIAKKFAGAEKRLQGFNVTGEFPPLSLTPDTISALGRGIAQELNNLIAN